ncbi:hypothetical protein PG996_010856 [Apiospora saccharicola]|uniref:Uncharacterized protein n=1 Tax=Apiospora saccharicola TaxID=335842 RepID=A0ABR1UPU5_9PEZI
MEQSSFYCDDAPNSQASDLKMEVKQDINNHIKKRHHKVAARDSKTGLFEQSPSQEGSANGAGGPSFYSPRASGRTEHDQPAELYLHDDGDYRWYSRHPVTDPPVSPMKTFIQQLENRQVQHRRSLAAKAQQASLGKDDEPCKG